jgi:HK97 family phage prohead protease
MKPTKGQRETRSFAGELRADGGAKFELSGYAASFNTLSRDLGGFRERIAPGAFKRSLAAGTDVKCLFNHDANVVLGRVGNKTLAVSEDARGLKFTCQLNPASQQHRDIYESVKRGDVSQCSFAFQVRSAEDEDWDEDKDERGVRFPRRTIRNCDLLDVSAVTYPAYSENNATSVQARAADYTATSAAAFDAMAKRKAQKIKEQIFQTCDAFILPDEYIEGQPWEPIPVFFTPEQKAAREAARLDAEDAALRARADAIGRQIEIDTLKELFGE